MSLVRRVLKRLLQWFIAGVLALLPLIITVGVVVWVAGYVKAIFGPGTMFGQVMRRFGLQFVSNETGAFVIGVLLVLGAIFLVGVGAESGARKLMQRLFDALLHRIPLIGSIYGTSKQVVAMLDRRDTEALKGMQVVLCYFGQQGARDSSPCWSRPTAIVWPAATFKSSSFPPPRSQSAAPCSWCRPT